MDESRVSWRPWGESAFAAADRTGKPVLLWLTTAWCSDCREMARETFGDPRIAANVEDGFVPVHADAERQPRVRERYAMGGFPSTVFCTPDGSVLTGAGYLGPDGFREILDRVRETYDAHGATAGSVPNALQAEPPGGDLSAAVPRHFAGQLEAQWDEANDGWGADAKFPLPGAVRFALRHDQSRGVRALDAIDRHLTGPDGGFFRHSRRPDWSDPARERTTLSNATVLRAFADGYLTTGAERFRGTATANARFLRRELWLDPGFGGSLAADDGRDSTRFADANAAAADALLTLTAYTDDRAARTTAEETLAFLRSAHITDGRVHHVATGEQTGHDGGEQSDYADGEQADHDDNEQASHADSEQSDHVDSEQPTHDSRSSVATGEPETDLLTDITRVVGAFTTAAQVLGEGTAVARRVADRALERLATQAAFRDGPTAGAGLLDRPLYPVDETARFADHLVDLAVLTGEDRYRRRGEAALAAFADATDRMGVQVATYARASERTLREPLVVSVATPPGSDLHRAALRLADHGKVVVPNAEGPPTGTARVGDTEPAGDPATLAARIEDV